MKDILSSERLGTESVFVLVFGFFVWFLFEPALRSRSFLEMEIALSQDQISKYADKILLYTNTCMKELRRLFLVQDLVDSLKVCVDIPRSDILYLLHAIRQLLNVFSASSLCFSLLF